jgi:polysaccharide export outer membrane protein
MPASPSRYSSISIACRILLALGLMLAPLSAQNLIPADTAPAAPSDATPPSDSPATPDAAATPAAAGSTPAEGTIPSGSYSLQSNDLIRITVFQEDDLTTETRISKSGSIRFPLIGSVTLRGKSVDDATAEIRNRLNKDYIIDPQVTLTVLSYARQWVTVLGEVQKPGQVEIPPEGGLDLLGAIALAGGYTRVANPGRVIVRREVDGRDVVLQVNAKELARDVRVKQFMVQAGDRISVGESIF